MFHEKVRCPHCGHEFSYSIFRFNSTVECEKCGKKIYIETKNSMYMLLFLVFLLASDYIRDFLVHQFPEQSEVVYFLMMFAIMMLAILVVMFVLIKLFGFTSIYRIRDDQFYREQVEKASSRKENKNNKKNKK